MLILFDIDATLLTTSRTGIAAMGEAGRERFGETFDEGRVEYAGRLDPLIIADLLRAHGREATDEAVLDFRQRYRAHLSRLVSKPGVARACPGVHDLLAALRRSATHTLGLLTGNFPETGSIKLRASGIDPDDFPVQAWGCDSPHSPPAREHLPPIAMRRYVERYGRGIKPSEVTIVGDTPHDIACARAHGCRSLGVATGQFSVDALAASGADRAVPDLTDTEEMVRWLMRQ
ncbi:MAG: haloacid dehalogenase-like hydrolase [Phycisphaerae bacterium]|nr:haloacid dehalogenase-like hydrolase [Phycisphaerae bacterium]